MWRVIVVDPDKDSRVIFSTLLQEIGCEVHCVSSPEECLSMMARTELHLVITEIFSSTFNGHWIGDMSNMAHEGGARLLVVSAHALPEAREYAEAAGADGYLAKPVAPLDVLNAAKALLVAGRRRD